MCIIDMSLQINFHKILLNLLYVCLDFLKYFNSFLERAEGGGRERPGPRPGPGILPAPRHPP